MIKISRKITGWLLIISLMLSCTTGVYAGELSDSSLADTAAEAEENVASSKDGFETDMSETFSETDAAETMTDETEETGETIESTETESAAETIETEISSDDQKETETIAEQKAEDIFVKVPVITDDGDIKALNPGHTLSVSYKVKDSSDKTKVQWMAVDQTGKTVKVLSKTKDCLITGEASGYYIRLQIDVTEGTNEGYQYKTILKSKVGDKYERLYELTDVLTPLKNGTNIYLAGDSTVRDYSDTGLYSDGQTMAKGSWGEFLEKFFDRRSVRVNNYANGLRSSRRFINEGGLAKIESTIQKGDYLFIQFGHNDEKSSEEEMRVPLGTPDSNGIYPTTPGVLKATPDNLIDEYGPLYYSSKCGGTYKWYLSQYVETALDAGAIPVLVTPISRMRFDSSGKIIPNHDWSSSSNHENAYVKAVKQLYEEYKAKGVEIYLIDLYESTVQLYETAYSYTGSTSLVLELFGQDDIVHTNKLGGFLLSEEMANLIRESGMPLAKKVRKPSGITIKDYKGNTAVKIDSNGTLTAYQQSGCAARTTKDSYWTRVGQYLLDIKSSNASLSVKNVNVRSADKGLYVTWQGCSNAEGYYIYRRTKQSGSWGKWSVVKTIKPGYLDKWKDTSISDSVVYQYTVRAYNGSTKSALVSDNMIQAVYIAKPEVSLSNVSKGVQVSWNKVKNAGGYYIYRREKTSDSWKKVKEITDNKTFKWTDTSVKAGKRYYYTVVAYKGDNKSAYTEKSSIVRMTAPSVTAQNASKGIKVSWNKVSGAAGYYVYRSQYNGKEWSKWTKLTTIDDSSKLNYTDTSVSEGKTYRYTVRGYNGSSSGYYVAGKSIYRLSQPDFKLSNTSKGVKVQWSKNKYASGYYVYRKNSEGKWQKVAEIEGSSTVSWTDKDVKKNKTYTYTLKTVRKNDASSFHSGKSIKYQK